MHVWTVPDTAALLDCQSTTAIPKETHTAAKNRRQIGILALPPKLRDGSAGNNTAAGGQPLHPNAMAHVWPNPLPLCVEHFLGEHT